MSVCLFDWSSACLFVPFLYLSYTSTIPYHAVIPVFLSYVCLYPSSYINPTLPSPKIQEDYATIRLIANIVVRLSDFVWLALGVPHTQKEPRFWKRWKRDPTRHSETGRPKDVFLAAQDAHGPMDARGGIRPHVAAIGRIAIRIARGRHLRGRRRSRRSSGRSGSSTRRRSLLSAGISAGRRMGPGVAGEALSGASSSEVVGLRRAGGPGLLAGAALVLGGALAAVDPDGAAAGLAGALPHLLAAVCDEAGAGPAGAVLDVGDVHHQPLALRVLGVLDPREEERHDDLDERRADAGVELRQLGALARRSGRRERRRHDARGDAANVVGGAGGGGGGDGGSHDGRGRHRWVASRQDDGEHVVLSPQDGDVEAAVLEGRAEGGRDGRAVLGGEGRKGGAQV